MSVVSQVGVLCVHECQKNEEDQRRETINLDGALSCKAFNKVQLCVDR